MGNVMQWWADIYSMVSAAALLAAGFTLLGVGVARAIIRTRKAPRARRP